MLSLSDLPFLSQTIRLGALLNQSDDLIVTARAGTVQTETGNKLWVSNL